MSKAMKAPRDLHADVAPEGSEGERSEQERTDGATAGAPTALPDPEVRDKPVRRTYTAQYKRRILAEADAAREPGAIGALLRREGLYSSLLSEWRAARARAARAAFAPNKRGPKAAPKDPRDVELQRLTRENETLHKKLRKAELMIDLQKKVSQILGITLPALEHDDEDGRTR
jgi:transposase